MSVSVKVKGDKATQRVLRELAEEFPKEAARALNATAKKSVSAVRKRVVKQMRIKQKILKERVRWRGAKAPRLIADVWFGTGAGVDSSEVKGMRRKKKRPITEVLPRAKAYTAKFASGDTVEYIRTRNYARPAMEQEPEALMRGFFPKEFKRLIGVTIQRRARRSRK